MKASKCEIVRAQQVNRQRGHARTQCRSYEKLYSSRRCCSRWRGHMAPRTALTKRASRRCDCAWLGFRSVAGRWRPSAFSEARPGPRRCQSFLSGFSVIFTASHSHASLVPNVDLLYIGLTECRCAARPAARRGRIGRQSWTSMETIVRRAGRIWAGGGLAAAWTEPSGPSGGQTG